MGEVFREYLIKVMEIDSITLDTEQVKTMEKLSLRLDDITNSILSDDIPVNPAESTALQVFSFEIFFKKLYLKVELYLLVFSCDFNLKFINLLKTLIFLIKKFTFRLNK